MAIYVLCRIGSENGRLPQPKADNLPTNQRLSSYSNLRDLAGRAGPVCPEPREHVTDPQIAPVIMASSAEEQPAVRSQEYCGIVPTCVYATVRGYREPFRGRVGLPPDPPPVAGRKLSLALRRSSHYSTGVAIHAECGPVLHARITGVFDQGALE